MQTTNSQNAVNRGVEQTLAGEFQSLLLTHPRAAIEFVRHARNRSHPIFGGANRALLADAGLIALGKRLYPVHDVWRDFVFTYVAGADLGIHSHNPLKGSCACEVVRLRNDRTASQELVDAIYRDFEALHHGDPVAFAELVRKAQSPDHRPYGRTGETLTTLGYLDLDPTARKRIDAMRTVDVFGIVAELQTLAKDPTIVVVHDVVQWLLPLCVTGQQGLEITLRKPYQVEEVQNSTGSGEVRFAPMTSMQRDAAAILRATGQTF